MCPACLATTLLIGGTASSVAIVGSRRTRRRTTMSSRPSDLSTSIGLLILRLGVAGYLLSHGVGKLRMLAAGNWEMLGDPIGIGPHLTLILATVAEFLCSLLVIAGLFTHFAAVPPVVAMAVAALVVHAPHPWSAETAAMAFFAGSSEVWFSKEPALVYLFPFLCLVFTGAGRFSLDGWLRGRRRPAA
jgi:putative oxidoreductase